MVVTEFGIVNPLAVHTNNIKMMTTMATLEAWLTVSLVVAARF